MVKLVGSHSSPGARYDPHVLNCGCFVSIHHDRTVTDTICILPVHQYDAATIPGSVQLRDFKIREAKSGR